MVHTSAYILHGLALCFTVPLLLERYLYASPLWLSLSLSE